MDTVVNHLEIIHNINCVSPWIPLSNAILTSSTDSLKPDILYRPSDFRPGEGESTQRGGVSTEITPRHSVMSSDNRGNALEKHLNMQPEMRGWTQH